MLRSAMQALDLGDAGVDLHIVSDAVMRRINRKTRGKDEPTDVLSFENFDFPSGGARRHLGEIFISPASARRKGHGVEHLVIHGLLHLLGYTHDAARDTMAMEKLEQKLIAHVTRRHRT